MTDDHGWPEIFPREHSNLIAKEEQEKYPWIFRCGAKGCYWTTAHTTKEQAQSIKEKHVCGEELRRMPRSDTDNLHGGYADKSIVEKIWGHLDEATKVVMETVEDIKKNGAVLGENEEKVFNEARGNARGLAIAIFEYSVGTGIFKDSGDVAKLAVKRYKATVAGEEMPLTPGVGGYNPQADMQREAIRKREAAEAKERGTPAPATTTAPASTNGAIKNKQGKALSEQDLTAIKNGIGANLPPSSLATVYKITVEQVEAIKASMSES